jgi:hypothetical protein
MAHEETPTNEFRWNHKSEYQINPATITLEQKWRIRETKTVGPMGSKFPRDFYHDEWRPVPVVKDGAMKTEPEEAQTICD